MANTTLNYGTVTTVLSTELNGLAAGGNATSAEQTHDGSPLLEVSVELAAAAASTETVSVYLAGGTETTKTATTVNTPNMRFIGSVTLNGTTVVRSTFDVIINPPQFYKIHLRGAAGVALAATGNTVKVRSTGYTTA